jgi:glycerol-3-phosphate dehydrogenase
MQNTDKRIVFAIPYREHYTLLGTTDVEYKGDPNDVAISENETQYILKVANDHFKKTLTPADVVWSYSGVRPLLEDESSDPSAVTRDYTLHLDDQNHKAPLLSIFGGKITTYRKLALSAMKKLTPYFDNLGDEWTHSKPLPGGDLGMSLDGFAMKLQQDYPFIGAHLAHRFANSYGALTHTLLNKANSEDDLGQHFGNQLYQVEVDYLISHEWAHSAEDILWRRTKLGLEFTPDQVNTLESYIQTKI